MFYIFKRTKKMDQDSKRKNKIAFGAKCLRHPQHKAIKRSNLAD